ncbi:rhodanese-like domain-containing protein [Halorussus gelatinilyticus]|uniref:Rhodanese-like domain-containing protein n=1 Tax=Halorussus gelatinilyticus TaxID=2937524 RepID=A0A8U0IQ34_9EURY|nr:rhodanese-like domain-containing protein [Halorussus gelatinilyticus]UPW02214.1 rhodanese-like domain-containing protein [Halorussus gelatinilyticus]
MDAEIAPDEVRELLDADDEVRILDIRSEEEFERGHIPGSENVPFHALADEIERLDGARRVVTVCPHGKASVQAARLVASYEGLPDDARVESMAGGLSEWDHELETAEGSAGDAEADASENSADGPDAPF